MSKISIIIPCYNVIGYIDRCLNSIINQTFGISDLQIILVNDASTDNTLEVLEGWEKQYPDNILVITYDVNIRQGGARNRGLEYADGDFISFIDADDFVEPEMYQVLYDKAIETGVDIVKCKHIRDDGSGIVLNRCEPRDKYYQFEKRGQYYDYNVTDTGDNGGCTGVWGGIIKKELIKENNLCFPEGLFYEDNFWNEILALYQKDLYIVDRQFYHYWVNNESTILKRNNTSILDKLTVEVNILEYYKQRGIFDDFADKLFWGFLNRAYIGLMYHIYYRFDYLFIDINELKAIVVKCFPDYKQRINLNMAGDCIANRLLLEFLLSGESLSEKEQELLKIKFIEHMNDYLRKENA